MPRHFWKCRISPDAYDRYILSVNIIGVNLKPSGPAGKKIGSGRAFEETELRMSDSGEAITVHYVLATGLHAVHERCRPGSMHGPPDFVRCRSGLGLDFLRNFASLANIGPVSCFLAVSEQCRQRQYQKPHLVWLQCQCECRVCRVAQSPEGVGTYLLGDPVQRLVLHRVVLADPLPAPDTAHAGLHLQSWHLSRAGRSDQPVPFSLWGEHRSDNPVPTLSL